MNKILILAGIALALGACAPDAPEVIDQRANEEFRDTLPEGCKVHYLGELNRGTGTGQIPMVAVVCQGKRTTSVSTVNRTGKTTRPFISVTVEDEV